VLSDDVFCYWCAKIDDGLIRSTRGGDSLDVVSVAEDHERDSA
jgi:hypothetical protein